MVHMYKIMASMTIKYDLKQNDNNIQNRGAYQSTLKTNGVVNNGINNCNTTLDGE